MWNGSYRDEFKDHGIKHQDHSNRELGLPHTASLRSLGFSLLGQAPLGTQKNTSRYIGALEPKNPSGCTLKRAARPPASQAQSLRNLLGLFALQLFWKFSQFSRNSTGSVKAGGFHFAAESLGVRRARNFVGSIRGKKLLNLDAVAAQRINRPHDLDCSTAGINRVRQLADIAAHLSGATAAIVANACLHFCLFMVFSLFGTILSFSGCRLLLAH